MAKKSPLEKTIKVLMGNRLASQKWEQTVTRLIERILAEDGLWNQARYLNRVALCAERRFWAGSGKKKVKKAGRKLLGRIAKGLYEHDHLDLFFHIYGHIYGPENIEETLIITHLTAAEFEGVNDWKTAAFNYFVQEFFRTTGADLELSVEFALGLLRKVALGYEEEAAGVVHLLGGGTDPTGAAHLIISQTLRLPAVQNDDCPMRHWFNTLITSVDTGNAAVDEVFDAILCAGEQPDIAQEIEKLHQAGVFTEMPEGYQSPDDHNGSNQEGDDDALFYKDADGNKKPRPGREIAEIYESRGIVLNPPVKEFFLSAAMNPDKKKRVWKLRIEIEDPKEGLKVIEDAMASGGIQEGPSFTIKLTPDQHEHLSDWLRRRELRVAQKHASGERVLEWYRQRKDELSQLAVMKCDDILRRPKRGMRPKGQDHVEITLEPLINVGLRSIAFHPEGCEYPNFKVHIVSRRRESPHLVVVYAGLEGFKFSSPVDWLLEAPVHQDEEELRCLLELVIIDILYRVMVEERKLDRNPSAKRPPVDRVGGHVASHLRPLPAGQSASEEARRAYEEEFGQTTLPEGYTFVRGHYRSGTLEYHLPTEPVFVYGETDLFQAGL